jgi:hypothetical protein
MAREESDLFNGDSLKIHHYWVNKKYLCRYQTDTRTLPLALVLAKPLLSLTAVMFTRGCLSGRSSRGGIWLTKER